MGEAGRGDEGWSLGDLGDAALHYALRGWRVFPLTPGSKIPLIRGGRGVLDATTDPAQIRAWWSDAPTANIGIACGNGLLVIDLDHHKEGTDGKDTWAAWCAEHGDPETAHALTPNDGEHHYFTVPAELAAPAARVLGPGVEYKYAGGYVVAPPSVYETRAYTWEWGCDPESMGLAALPPWLAALIAKPAAEPKGEPQDVALTAFFLGRAFAMADEPPRRAKAGTWAVKCPNHEAHTTGGSSRDTSTVLFAPHEAGDPGWLHCSHAHCQGLFDSPHKAFKLLYERAASPIRARLDALMAEEREQPTATDAPILPDGPVLRFMSEIEQEDTLWLARDRIPIGAVTLVVGMPGKGKSTLTLEWAARISRGELDGDLREQPATVIFANAEDAVNSTIRGRCVAAGGELTRLGHYSVRRGGLLMGLELTPEAIAELERAVEAHKVKLVIIDPLAAHLPAGVDSKTDAHVRRVLAPLARMAERQACAVVCIMHLNKSQTQDVMVRVSGSLGFVGAARSVLLVAEAPDNEERTCVLAHAKSNCGPLTPSMKFEVIEDLIDGPRGPGSVRTTHIVWKGETDVRAGDLLRPVEYGEERSCFEEACDFLRETLAEGWTPAQDVIRAAKEQGITARTLKRARQALGVRSRRLHTGNGRGRGCWEWSLPASAFDDLDEAENVLGGHPHSRGPLSPSVANGVSDSAELSPATKGAIDLGPLKRGPLKDGGEEDDGGDTI